MSVREGSLDAPVRHPIPWDSPDFHDAGKLEAEMRRVFDICHGCRRCFNLCDSFPRLFDLIDESETGELDSVATPALGRVVDACTLCDMCFMTKCPYVPPHEFNVDFPQLMLRARAFDRHRGRVGFAERQFTETDRNGRLAGKIAPLANWACDTDNRLIRTAMEKIAGIDRRAALPKFHFRSFTDQARRAAPEVNREAPAFGRKAVIYATCLVNYHRPKLGLAARAVLALNGVETEVHYPGCCGTPQLEQGDLARVARQARMVAAALRSRVDQGWAVIAPVPSCALMMKFEWPLVVPGDEDVKRVSEATFDISEYLVDIARREGLAPGLEPLEGGVSLHLACHARAQNMGHKAAELMRLVPDTEVSVIERCSGHGGSWGIMRRNFDTALKVGRPVARQAVDEAKAYVASECPLAAEHIVQGMALIGDGDGKGDGGPRQAHHPIELFAAAYGLPV